MTSLVLKGPGTLLAGDYLWGYTKTNTKRGLEEQIAANVELTVSGGSDGVSLTIDTDANHTYNIYFADAEGSGATTRLAHEGVVGTGLAAQIVLTDLTASTALAKPAQPGSETVFTNYIFGTDAFSVVDLTSLKTLVSKGAQKSDPLDQIRTMGTKFFMTSLILNNAFMVRIEAASAY